MSRVDPNVPIEEGVGGMAELVKEGKTRFISLSECSAESLKQGSAFDPLVSLQMEYLLFSRDAEEHGQIDACKGLRMAMMAYAVLGRGMLSDQVPKVEVLAADDVRQRLPRFQSANIEKNLGLRSALEALSSRRGRRQAGTAIPNGRSKMAPVASRASSIPDHRGLRPFEGRAFGRRRR
jgi:aryl-alcohol dehydrogenase-like predicted oxidoreductase